jgi:hypothetical protein
MRLVARECSIERVHAWLARGADPKVTIREGRSARDAAFERALTGDQRCNAVVQVLGPGAAVRP